MRPPSRQAFLQAASYFESALLLVACLVGWLAGVNPWADLRPGLAPLLWGVGGTLPLCLLFGLSYRLPVGGLKGIKRLLIDQLGPYLDTCRTGDLFYLGLLAGVTEEVLFRGLLQPLAEARWGWAAGLLGSNLLFALAHSISPLYALLAGLTGVYLGVALDFGGERNLLTPILIHALYDFLAFLVVVQTYRAERGRIF